MRLVRRLLEAAFILNILAATAAAHHSAAAYDIGSLVRIDGTVTEFDWGNPHVYIEVDAIASDTLDKRSRLVELAHPGTVSLLGLEPLSLKAGDEVSILANPPRNAARGIASFVALEIGGVTAIDMREMGQAFQSIARTLGTEPAASIEGFWVPAPDAWQQSGLNDITNLPLTESAQNAGNDSLVIDTVGFAPHPQGIAPRVPSSPRKHLVERFELNPDGKSLSYSFELEDPVYLVGTISGTADWLHLTGTEVDPIPCSLTNARRFLAD